MAATRSRIVLTRNVIVVCVCLLQCISQIKGREPSVLLTIEGGIRLDDPLCPGTIRLRCEGVDLTILRWNYDTANNIASFDTNDSPSSESLSHPAFEKAELLSIQPAQDDQRFAMFVSVLTVNLRQLQEQSVRNISCGAPGIVKNIVIPLSITFLQPAALQIPIVTAVMATYRSEMLSSVTVSWKKLVCPEFEESLYHELTLTGHNPVRVDQASCGDTLCAGTIPDIRMQESRPSLSLRSHNSNGSSGIYTFLRAIEQRSEMYFKSGLNFIDCQAEIRCELAGGLNTNASSCTVQYGIESESGNVSVVGEITTSFNTPFRIPRLSTGITYSFEFSVPVTETLLIVNTVQGTLDTSVCGSSLPTSSANILTTLLIVALALVHLVT